MVQSQETTDELSVKVKQKDELGEVELF
jgi:hypothetical protein